MLMRSKCVLPRAAAAILAGGLLANISAAQMQSALNPAAGKAPLQKPVNEGRGLDTADPLIVTKEPLPATADYDVVDNVEGPWVDMHFASVDPMMLVNGPTLSLYALNTHGSELLRFSNLNGQPQGRVALPWGPVSLASWIDGGGKEYVLVTCRGNYCLVFVDPVSERIDAIIELPDEPADIEVIDELGIALVACASVDSVVQVNLVTREIEATYPIRSKAPTFLTRGPGNTVLAAPMLSGNNSTVHVDGIFPIFAGFLGIMDGANGPWISVGLPDEDLFLIDPAAGTVTPQGREIGTILFDLEVHPVTGDVWMLNMEADNKDPNKIGEAALQGDFIANRMSIVTLPTGSTLSEPNKITDLDALTVGEPIGQPYTLEFSAAGFAFVGGVLTDNIVVLDPNGDEFVYLDETDGIPDGAIIRDIELGLSETTLFVYCWGTNTIEVILVNQVPFLHVATLDLGHDPSPFKRGREIFFDGKNSANKNSSCASCHIETRTDMLLWDLSDLQKDDKGPLVTQTLAGIDKTPPFHWRGERPGLIDFNGAFDGLLGGAELDETPGGDFDAFRDFVFSVQNPANPNQDDRRVLNTELAEPLRNGGIGDPIQGQEFYFTDASVGPETCQDCHTLPTGASGDSFGDLGTNPNPRRTNLDVPHYQEIHKKEQEIVEITFINNATRDVALLGSGLAHSGIFDDLLDFHTAGFGMPFAVENSIFEFVNQIDQGIAPAVHKAYLVDEGTLAEVKPSIEKYLFFQAQKRNCDIAVWGEVTHGSDAGPNRWFYNRDTGLFESEDSSSPDRNIGFFVDERVVRNGTWFTFVGMPVGSAERFAVDYDSDELRNVDELALGTDPIDSDSDNDRWRDGHEVTEGGDPLDDQVVPNDTTPPVISNVRVLWNSAKHARVQWETDEPTEFQIEYSTNVQEEVPAAPGGGGAAPGVQFDVRTAFLPPLGPSGRYVKTHSVMLTDLLPSTDRVREFTYTGEIRATDLGGNTTIAQLPAFTTQRFIVFSEDQVKLTRSEVENLAPDTSSLKGELVVDVVRKTHGPPHPPKAGWVVAATIHVNGTQIDTWTDPSGNPTDFTIAGVAPVLDGPFLTAVTGADGRARATFDIPGLTTGDEILFVIEYVMDPPPTWPIDTDFETIIHQQRWDFTVTPKEARTAETTF